MVPALNPTYNCIPATLKAALLRRQSDLSLRTLSLDCAEIDLCSNDYLGLGRSTDFVTPFQEWFYAKKRTLGATGSRLISGNRAEVEEVESFIANFHKCEAALLFGSGFEANTALLGCIATRHDTILYDQYVHASMREGIRLSTASSYGFRHNNLDDLERLLVQVRQKNAKGEIYIAVESVYSMDGDCLPLKEIVSLSQKYGAHLVVDEAHSTGLHGKGGSGYVQEHGLQANIFARVHTFGKALGFRGACIVGSSVLREYLINFSRQFIYSTGPDLFSVWGAQRAYEHCATAEIERSKLRKIVTYFNQIKSQYPDLITLQSVTPIQGIVVPGNERMLAAEKMLQSAGLGVRAIRSPTVSKGSERLRICLHSFNKEEEIQKLFSISSEQ